MVVRKVERNVKCDTIGCRERAKYTLAVTETGRRTFVCEKCADAIYRAVLADTVPESPTSIFLKKDKVAKEAKAKTKGEK